MKNKVKAFLRLRKQNDLVKILCIFSLLGAGFFMNGVYHVWGLYQYVNTPAEYVLTGEGLVSQKRMDELQEIKGITQVSRQMDVQATLVYRGSQGDVECIMVSQEYLENMLGTKIPTGMQRFYMNETAFEQWKQTLEENNEGLGEVVGEQQADGTLVLDIRYAMLDVPEGQTSSGDGDMDSALAYKSAKLVVVKNADKEGEVKEEGMVCAVATDSQLLKAAFRLRVKFAGHDLDGLQVSKLSKLGYVIENENTVITEEYEVKIRLCHIWYGLLCFGICVVGASALWWEVKRVKG